MDFFDDWGTSLSNAFQRTASGFRQVFTNPGKANLGDFFSVALPFWGGTIVNDIKNPKDAGYQALTVAALAGGAHLIAPGSKVAAIGPNGYATLPAREGAGKLVLSSTPGNFTGAGIGDGIVAPLAGVPKLVKDAAALSVAARQVTSPWERAIDTIRDAVSGSPASGGSTVTNVSAGGGGPAPTDSERPMPAEASSGGFFMTGLVVTAVVGIAYSLLNPWWEK